MARTRQAEAAPHPVLAHLPVPLPEEDSEPRGFEPTTLGSNIYLLGARICRFGVGIKIVDQYRRWMYTIPLSNLSQPLSRVLSR